MPKIKQLVFLLLLFPLHMLAQDFQSLRAPATPAFSILNFEPSAIMKPGSVKDLGGDLLHSIDENGRLRMNLGLEFSPYWLKSRPTLTRAQYEKPTFGQRIAQTLNISAATVRDTISKTDKLGIGIRFQLLNGNPSEAYVQQQAQLKSRLSLQSIAGTGRAYALAGSIKTQKDAQQFFTAALQKSQSSFSGEELAQLNSIFTGLLPQYQDSSMVAFFEALNNALNSANSPLVQSVITASKKRNGIHLEFAAAVSFADANRAEKLDRSGIWLTASKYVDAQNSWHVNTRYQFSSRDTAINNLDIGVAYAKELPNFSITAEAVFRWYQAYLPDRNIANQPITKVERSTTYRMAIQANYLINKNASIHISLGKDFNSPIIRKQGIFSIFGINYALFNPAQVIQQIQSL